MSDLLPIRSIFFKKIWSLIFRKGLLKSYHIHRPIHNMIMFRVVYCHGLFLLVNSWIHGVMFIKSAAGCIMLLESVDGKCKDFERWACNYWCLFTPSSFIYGLYLLKYNALISKWWAGILSYLIIFIGLLLLQLLIRMAWGSEIFKLWKNF